MKHHSEVKLIGDLTSEWARDTKKHEELKADIRLEFEKQLPFMVERIAETHPFMVYQDLEYSTLLLEARSAYANGFWRPVIALIGIAGESFIDSLYKTINHVGNTQMNRQELFGSDENVRTKNKIAALLLCGIIEKPIYTKLCCIKKLRDNSVHPSKEIDDLHSEAKEALNKFIEIMDWHVNKTFGKITPEMSITIEESE